VERESLAQSLIAIGLVQAGDTAGNGKGTGRKTTTSTKDGGDSRHPPVSCMALRAGPASAITPASSADQVFADDNWRHPPLKFRWAELHAETKA